MSPCPFPSAVVVLTWAWVSRSPSLFQAKAALDVLAQKIATFTDVGNSLAHVEHLLKDLISFEEKSSAAVERARALSLKGEQLIDNKHYAVDSIRPKCHELQDLCDQFAAEVAQRKGLLNKSLELHGLLEAVGPQPHTSDGKLTLCSSLHMGYTTAID